MCLVGFRESKPYAVVRFTVTNVISVVPSCWLHDKSSKTWWPKQDANVKRWVSARNTKVDMGKSYTKYDIEVLDLAGTVVTV